MKKAIFKVSLISALLGMALTVSAASLTQTQIDAILGLLRSFGADESVVANVETSMKGGTPTTQPREWCHTFNVNLKIGDRSNEVQELETALDKEGFTVELSDRAREPLFNESFASAVVGFQEKYKSEILTPNGLTRGTGYVGPSTRKKLNLLYGCGIKQQPIVCTQDAKQCLDGSEIPNAYIKSLTKSGKMLLLGWVRSDVESVALAGVRISSEDGSFAFTNQDGYFELSFPVQAQRDACIGETVIFARAGYKTEKWIHLNTWGGGDTIVQVRLKPGSGETVNDKLPHPCLY